MIDIWKRTYIPVGQKAFQVVGIVNGKTTDFYNGHL